MLSKILITGGSGFIGAHVARELLAAGYSVRVLNSRETGHPCRRSVIAATAKPGCREPHIPPTCQNFPSFSTPPRNACVSIEAGVESITESGGTLLKKKCRLSTAGITARLFYAKQRVAFVQANLLDSRDDDPADVASWREELHSQAVWSNQPVPLFSYPGSPDYVKRWGPPGDRAWNRAHQHYLKSFHELSDLQAPQPASLEQLKCM